MKRLLLIIALLASSPAVAQWQVPLNSIPVGRGAGVTGFNSVANSGTGAACLLNTTPPTFGPCGNVVNAKTLGVKQDGIVGTYIVTIGSGSSALTAVGATFTAADVGKYIMVPGAGATSRYLTTTIATFTDATHVGLAATASTAVNTASKTVTYCSNDSTAIANAVTSVLANNQTLVFTDGVSCHSGTNNWAFNNLHVQFQSDNATFIHVGTGIANSFNGMLNYPGSQGANAGVFGGPGRPVIRGNPAGGTTVCNKIDNWHNGYMKASLRDCTTGLLGTNTGVVSSSSVSSIYDLVISINYGDGAFIVPMNRAIDFTSPNASIFTRPLIEGAGTGGNKCWVFTGAINNTVNGGAIESCLAGGISEDSTSSRNTYNNLDVESNGSAADWTLAGKYAVVVNGSGAATTAGNTFSGQNTMLLGGKFQTVTISDNTLWSNGTEFVTDGVNPPCTVTGTNVTIINQIGGFCPSLEGATSILENKICNTASGCAIKFNSKVANDLSGTTTVLGTTSGTLTSGNCVRFDASGNLVASGSASCGSGTGTVTSIATTSPITGGTITTTGTIACATCVTSAAALTSNALVIGGGLQASSTTTTGTGVLTALGTNVGSVGAFITFNGNAGTPSALIGTNISGTAAGLTAGSVTTNANLTGAVTSSGNATSLGSFSSANLNTALTDETGSGVAVFGTSPVLSTVDARGVWTTGTSWTLPAHTLAGTVSGGGQQLNNVIIGTTTPLAGTFTTLGSGAHTITSASAAALTVGPNGATNPAFTVDASTASQAAGLKVTGAATGGTVAVAATDSGSNTSLTLSAKGTGTIGIGSASTGAVNVTPQMILANGVGNGLAFKAAGGATDWVMYEGAGGALNITPGATNVLILGSIMDYGSTTASVATFAVPSTFSSAAVKMTALATDAAATDSTVCVKSSDGTLLKGSGTLGICLGTSSARYKHDIVSMGAGLAEIMKLTPKNFYYNSGHGDGGAKLQYGFIAEDVVKAIPNLAGRDEQGRPNTVDMLAMVPILVNAMKELKGDNDNLRTRLAALENGLIVKVSGKRMARR